MTSTRDVAKILLDGAAIIERDGWWNGTVGGDYMGSDSECLATACHRAMAAKNSALWLEALARVAEYLGYGSDAGYQAIRWNDRQESSEPVIAVMRECAEKLLTNEEM